MEDYGVFWNGYGPIIRIVIVGTITFFAILIMLRSTGKRILAQMNAFDFILAVTIGSAFGRILTAREVSISETIITFILLLTLHYVLAWLEMRSPRFARLVSAQPTLLFYKGMFIDKNIRRERLRKEDLLRAVRMNGNKSLDDVEAIILESSGSFSVIQKSEKTHNLSHEDLINDSDGQKIM